MRRFYQNSFKTKYFISVDLPENIKSKIFEIFRELKKSNTCYGSFAKKNNLHLILKFFGELSSEELGSVERLLSELDLRQFPIESGKIGFFPNEKYIQVVWIEMLASEFDFIKSDIEDELKKRNLVFGSENFHPHINAARIKGVKDKFAFLSKIKKIAPSKMFFIANQLSLVKLTLKRQGPKYEVIKKFPMRMR